MNNTLEDIYKFIVPKPIRYKISIHREKLYLKKLRKKIVNFLLSKSEALSIEQKKVLNYLQNNPITIFPYDFVKKYNKDQIEVFYDKEYNFPFVFADNKKLYFKRSWSKEKIRRYYNTLRIEQDYHSPHRYLTSDFNINEEDIVADIGVAEGNFTLSVIEKIKFAYLFETDSEWIEALEATFNPWKEKIKIINKFVSDNDEETNVSLDSFLNNKLRMTFLKVDVDGAESKLLNGSLKLLENSSPLKIAICTYHQQNDENELSQKLNSLGFEVKTSEGYMIFYNFRDLTPPYLRRGLIRATKEV